MSTKVNINGKHLTKGDPFPPYTGKPRLYCMRFCPFAKRVLLALDAKQIDYEVINIDLVDKPEWYADKSLLGGKVPALEIKEGVLLVESSVIVEYIDEVYPQRPLLPNDPVAKAQDKILIEVVANTVVAFYLKLVKDPANLTQDHIASYHKGLEYVQAILKKRGTPFLDGNQPGYGDYMIWVWFERVLAFDEEYIQISDPKYAILNAYVKNMAEDPVVKLTYLPRDILQKFRQSYRTGNGKPDYDILHKYGLV